MTYELLFELKQDYGGAQRMIVIIMTDPQNDLWITRERENFQYVLQIANEIIVVFLDFF